ncbi:MAG: transglutaminaseTgpA domain-containing protein [Actinomycetota bacterium]
MTLRPAITTTLLMAALAAAAAAPFDDVFTDSHWLVSVLGAALAGAFAASAIETLKDDLSQLALGAVTVAGGVTWSLLVSLRDVFWSAPTARSTWTDLQDGVFGGWGALLDDQFPLTDPQSAEVFAGLIVWVAAATAVHVAARFRNALGGVVATAIVLWISTAAALPRGLSSAVIGAGAGAMALFAIATLTRAADQRWRPGRLLGLLAMVGVAAGLAASAGSLSTSIDRDPLDPRTSRDTDVVELQVPDILAEFGVRSEPGRTVMSIEGANPPTALRLRLQVYDAHDGARWLPATGFEEIARFPEPAILPPGDAVSYDLDIQGLDGPWIPLPDRLVETDVEDLQWNDDTQTALTGRNVTTFSFTGTVVGRAGLEGLPGAREEVAAELSEIPAGMPDDIRAAAEQAASGAADAISAIDAITARVRELGRDDTTAPGNSFGRLRDDLVGGRSTGPEQIASLHALMLRAVGIPSRLVVGYVATGPLIDSSDLHVWTEAAFPGIGWVASDPVPAVSEPADDPDDDTTVTTTSMAQDTALQARALPRELGPGEDPDEPEIGADDELTLAETIALVAIGLVVAVAILAAIRAVRRRIRRSSGWKAEVRVLGAWAELVDRLRELGAPITATTTIDDVVYMATEIDAALGEQARVIGDVAAIALHAPHGSHPDDAELAWDRLHDAETALGAARGRRVVLRRLVDPRVLRYRSPKPPTSRDGGRRGRTSTPS